MWGYYYTLMGAERVRQHWRNLVARYAAFPVVFCIAGEVNLPPVTVHLPPWPTDDASAMGPVRDEQLAGWSAAAHEVRRIDPWHNPITAHPAHPDVRRVLPDASRPGYQHDPEQPLELAHRDQLDPGLHR